MVKEDDSDIKEASDVVPALRNIEDQRSTQSRRLSLGRADVYLPRQVPRDDITQGSGLVLQSWNADLSAHQELIHFFQGQIHRHQTLRACKNQKDSSLV